MSYTDWKSIRPRDVLDFDGPTKGFLVPIEANTYGVDFLSFRIRDAESKKVVFEVSKDPDAPPPDLPEDFDMDLLRTIRYTFPAEMLTYEDIETTLNFAVGSEELHDFRMIERHYFKGELVQSYDFQAPFCMPNSRNEWQSVYNVPPLSNSRIQEMIDSPGETVSDSFYFVEGKLIMHNKAYYSYKV